LWWLLHHLQGILIRDSLLDPGSLHSLGLLHEPTSPIVSSVLATTVATEGVSLCQTVFHMVCTAAGAACSTALGIFATNGIVVKSWTLTGRWHLMLMVHDASQLIFNKEDIPVPSSQR
jgi:hypothetical protein